MEANCRKWTAEIVERVRAGSQPGADLRQHLRECPHCRERREDEQKLTAQFHALRDAVAARLGADARRSRILAEFDAVHQRPAARPSRLLSWRWALAAAAAVLLIVGAVAARGIYRLPGAGQSTVAQVAATADGDNNGFVAIPYAPPLAAGEFVSVVRTEIQPTALANMGFYVDAGYASPIPADVVMGEDGVPRAVRLVEAIEF